MSRINAVKSLLKPIATVKMQELAAPLLSEDHFLGGIRSDSIDFELSS